jgi:hypothetical protein
MKRHCCSHPFLKEVPQTQSDYYQIIKNPRDLNIIAVIRFVFIDVEQFERSRISKFP